MTRYALPILILSLGLPTARAQDSFPQFEKRAHKEGKNTLPYRLLVPKAYQPGAACPLIVWLHGSGEKGTDNVRYRLNAAKGAAPEVAGLLAKIGKGQAAGEHAVTGTIELSDYAWLLVERIETK